MSKQTQHSLISFPRKDHGLSQEGYKKYFRNTSIPAINIQVSQGTIVESVSNQIIVDGNPICTETLTVSELIIRLVSMGITAHLMLPEVAMMPATLIEDFISKKTLVIDISRSPFKYNNIYSDIINNIPASKIATSYGSDVVSIINEDGTTEVITLNDVGDIDLGYLDNKKTAIIDTHATQFILFINKEKISSTHSIASSLDDNYLKYQLLTSLTINNSDIL